MKFFFSKNEDGHEVAERIVMVKETLDVPGIDTEQQEIVCAIAMALQLYTDSAKDEVLPSSIENSLKLHSSWSCKSHLLRQLPMYLPNSKRK
ncbi:MAG TPA: hypothetical protein VL095_17205 [Flavisolibacter sp.]|nr:hypothetical protein [Flavisolibacter sp.]